MEPKLGPAHAIGAAIAFAIGFLFISAVSAYADGVVPRYLPSTPENPTFQLNNAVLPQYAQPNQAMIPLFSAPNSDADVAVTVPAKTNTFIEKCVHNDRWCLVRLANGNTGWVDLVTLIDPNFRG